MNAYMSRTHNDTDDVCIEPQIHHMHMQLY